MLTVLKNTGKFSSLCQCKCGNTFSVKSRYDAKKSFIGHLCDECKYLISGCKSINQQFLKKAFDYDKQTGDLTYRHTQSMGKTGTLATSKHSGKYLTTRIGGIDYLAHRIIWKYMTGAFPDQIDHINHIRNDNVWINLRSVDNRENHLNESLAENSSTGVLGVSKIHSTGRFRAYIGLQGKQVHLGVFKTLAEACEVRKQANLHYNYHFNHGSK